VKYILANIILSGAISAVEFVTRGYQTKPLVVLFAALHAVLLLAIIVLLGRYLVRETDEFIRMMVVKAMLWGAAITVAGDMMQSTLVALNAGFWNLGPGALTLMNFDLYFVGSMFSLAIQLRRSR
jgi:hypothetical protein